MFVFVGNVICPICMDDWAGRNVQTELCDSCRLMSRVIAKNIFPEEYRTWKIRTGTID